MLTREIVITKEELNWMLYLLTRDPANPDNQELVHFLISRFAKETTDEQD